MLARPVSWSSSARRNGRPSVYGPAGWSPSPAMTNTSRNAVVADPARPARPRAPGPRPRAPRGAGTTSWPRSSSRAASSSVAGRPFFGEQVIETGAPAGEVGDRLVHALHRHELEAGGGDERAHGVAEREWLCRTAAEQREHQPALRRRRRPARVARRRADASGSSTTVARCGLGAVAWGKAIAATNSSWNRGSVAVSILTTSRSGALHLGPPLVRQQCLDGSCTGGVADRPHAGSTGQSGTRPRTMALTGSMCAPKAPASRTSVTSGCPACSSSSSMPARSAALASWIARTSFCVMARRVDPSIGWRST